MHALLIQFGIQYIYSYKRRYSNMYFCTPTAKPLREAKDSSLVVPPPYSSRQGFNVMDSTSMTFVTLLRSDVSIIRTSIFEPSSIIS